MHLRGFSLLSGLLALMLISMGCQGNPATPGAAPDSDISQSQAAAPGQPHHCLGLFSLAIDTQSGNIEVVPARTAEWHFNLTGMLNATMGVHAAGVPSEHDPLHGLFVFDITLTHPFAAKPQFAGFDVKGILMTPGKLAVGSLLFADASETELENADGYTRWWNPTEFTTPGFFGYTKGVLANASPSALTATVNPYKLFADILGPEGSLALVSDEPLDSDQGRAVFTAGSNNTRRYRIRFPMNPGPKIVYGYAIDAAWGLPSPNPPAQVPDDFPIQANQPEAFRIGLVPTLNSLYYDSESGTGGGVLRLQVNVHDWQGQLAGDIAGEVSAVRIFAPDLVTGGIDALFVDETSTKARYTADLTGLAVPGKVGETKVICRVGSTDGSSYKQSGAPAPDSTLSAFQAIMLDIPDPDCVGDSNNDFNEAMDLDLGQPTMDQMCAPNDYRDFYKMDVPLGDEVSGQIVLYCDVEPTKFSLFDGSETLITEASVAGGSASIDLTALGLMPGTYCFRVLTQSSGQAFVYLIDPEAQLVNVTPTNAQLVTPAGLYFAPRWVTMHGDIAYATGAYGLWILDYSNLLIPKLLAHLDINSYLDCEPVLSYPFLYYYRSDISGSWFIDVVDCTDPANPVLHSGVLAFTDPVTCIEAEADWLYVGVVNMPGTHRVEVYDISGDHTQPVGLNSFDTVGGAARLELVYDGDSPAYWLAVMTSALSMEVYDVTDKQTYAQVGNFFWGPGSQLLDITSNGNYFYLLLDTVTISYVDVFRVEPAGAGYVGAADLSNVINPISLAYSNNFIYAAISDGTLKIVDVWDPGNPFVYSWLNMGLKGINDLTSEDDFMLSALENAGLLAIEITAPGETANAGKVVGLGMPASFTISGDSLFASEYYGYSVIKTVDISDPPNTHVVSELEMPTAPNLVRTSGARMLVMDLYGSGLNTVDGTDPDSLQYIGAHTAGAHISDLIIRGDNAYLTTGLKELEIWNLGSWPTIAKTSSQPLTDYGYDLCTSDDILYMVVGGEKRIFSLVDPSFPEYVDTYTPLSDAWSIAIDGDYLYIATDGSLEIADISLPQTPTFVASEPHPDAPLGHYVAVEGQFAYLQPLSPEPPTVMRIWPPTDPAVIGDLYPNTGYTAPYQTFIYNGYCIERDANHAINIWDLY